MYRGKAVQFRVLEGGLKFGNFALNIHVIIIIDERIRNPLELRLYLYDKEGYLSELYELHVFIQN